MRNALLALMLVLAGPALAWQEPARGTELRADLLNAIRPLMEWNLGAPVEIVVHSLRVAGDLAFVSAYGQRPGGGAIGIEGTRITRRDGFDPHVFDGPTITALLQRAGRMWVAVRWEIGATDLWFASPEYCETWRPVLNESCN